MEITTSFLKKQLAAYEKYVKYRQSHEDDEMADALWSNFTSPIINMLRIRKAAFIIETITYAVDNDLTLSNVIKALEAMEIAMEDK